MGVNNIYSTEGHRSCVGIVFSCGRWYLIPTYETGYIVNSYTLSTLLYHVVKQAQAYSRSSRDNKD